MSQLPHGGLGIIRAKAYSSKDMVKSMYSSYRPFSSPALPLLTLTQDMIQDLDSMTTDRERVFTTRHSREAIHRAWEANKRHVRAIADDRAIANYGIRKEVTFSLSAILKEWSDGNFDADRNPHFGPLSHTISLRHSQTGHNSFWVVPTRDFNNLIFAQAARLVLPLDHLFREVTLSNADHPTGFNTAESFVRRLFAFYTAQLLTRLLAYSFCSERELSFDKWIWKSSWRVRERGGAVKERRGLGLEEQIDSSGMLWLPEEIMDWRRGHLELARLTELYMPRSPLQARLTSQKNIRGLTTNQLTVEYIIQERVQEAARAFRNGEEEKGHGLADHILTLCAEEIARAYNQHLLAKMHAYWDKVRSNVGRNVLSVLPRLRRAQEEAAAEKSRIVNAQTIWEICKDAWALYATAMHDDSPDSALMPPELPCWMTTRKHLPPKDGWSDFVFRHLFRRPVKPKWDRIYFLQLYRTFKKYWAPIKSPAAQFDDRLKRVLGGLIMVAFNSNQAKEVGTSHTAGTWYHGKPTFFQIQYWAPYFSPPQSNRDIRMESTPSAAPKAMSAMQFQDLERVVHRDWISLVYEADVLRSTDQETVNSYCRRALRRMALLAGPTWGTKDQLDHIVPWEIAGSDAFRVPLPAASTAKWGSNDLLSHPTIVLPSRENVIGMFRAIRSFRGLTTGLQQRLKWARRRLDNNGEQYDIRSHLEAKGEAAQLTSQSPSLLRQFLLQTEAPEWEIDVGEEDEPDEELSTAESEEIEALSDASEVSDGLSSLFSM